MIGWKKGTCQEPKCGKGCWFEPKRAIADRVCAECRKKRARRALAERNRVGACIRCGENTRQKDDQGRYFHRHHVAHRIITISVARDDQAALERMQIDTTSLHERERFLERMGKDAHYQTHGGESFYPPILTWGRR